MPPSSFLAITFAAAMVVAFGGLALFGPDHATASHYGMMRRSVSATQSGSMMQSGVVKIRVDRPEKGLGARVTYVRLVKGSVARRMRATVMTDTRCNPDAMGVSHCINRMRLANGMMVTAVHDHRMMDMPCLSPGERVMLAPPA